MSYYYDDYDDESEDYDDYWSDGPRTVRTVLGILAAIILIASVNIYFFGVQFEGADGGDDYWVIYSNGTVNTTTNDFPQSFIDHNGEAAYPGVVQGSLEEVLEEDIGGDYYGTTNPFLEFLQENGKGIFGVFGLLQALFYPNILMYIAAILTIGVTILRKTQKAPPGVINAIKVVAILFFFLSFFTLFSLTSARGGFSIWAESGVGVGGMFRYSFGFILGIIGGILSFFS
jgi:hypothetical protein